MSQYSPTVREYWRLFGRAVEWFPLVGIVHSESASWIGAGISISSLDSPRQNIYKKMEQGPRISREFPFQMSSIADQLENTATSRAVGEAESSQDNLGRIQRAQYRFLPLMIHHPNRESDKWDLCFSFWDKLLCYFEENTTGNHQATQKDQSTTQNARKHPLTLEDESQVPEKRLKATPAPQSSTRASSTL